MVVEKFDDQRAHQTIIWLSSETKSEIIKPNGVRIEVVKRRDDNGTSQANKRTLSFEPRFIRTGPSKADRVTRAAHLLTASQMIRIRIAPTHRENILRPPGTEYKQAA